MTRARISLSGGVFFFIFFNYITRSSARFRNTTTILPTMLDAIALHADYASAYSSFDPALLLLPVKKKKKKKERTSLWLWFDTNGDL